MIRVRIPPSPTGPFHIGTLRTALYNYLFAKQNGGVVLFRSEDTDKERSTREFEQQIFDGLVSMGLLSGDTPIVRQSERTELYKKALQKLLNSGAAYYCFMTPAELEADRNEQIAQNLPPRYRGKYRDYPKEEALKRIATGERAVIRLRVPENQEITWQDLVHGKTSANTKELDDFVIAKNLDEPLYHLAVVVDDMDMQVTHILRGDDHVSNTPKHILLFKALGAVVPEFAHLPLILNSDKSKMSKRKNKVSVQDYLDAGYLKEALINFLALVGWNPGGEREIYSLAELAEIFSLDRVQKSGAIFNLEKLNWFNKEWIKKLPIAEVVERARPFFAPEINNQQIQQAIMLEKERANTLVEIAENTNFLFADTLNYDSALLVWKKSTAEDAKQKLTEIQQKLSEINESDWTKEGIEKIVLDWIAVMGYGKGDVLWPTRVALSGKEKSPGPFEIAEALGKVTTIKRIGVACNQL